jgi:hypothetical protein
MQAAGMVVHQNAVGFGMMFDDLDPACRRALGRLLDGHKVSPDAPILEPVGILRTGSTG